MSFAVCGAGLEAVSVVTVGSTAVCGVVGKAVDDGAGFSPVDEGAGVSSVGDSVIVGASVAAGLVVAVSVADRAVGGGDSSAAVGSTVG